MQENKPTEPRPFKSEGPFKRTKLFKSTGEEVVAYGDTKEEAKSELKRKLEDYRDPRADIPGWRGSRYRPKLEVIGYVRSPGKTFVKGEDGKSAYKFVADRKAPVFARPDLAAKIGNKIVKEKDSE